VPRSSSSAAIGVDRYGAEIFNTRHRSHTFHSSSGTAVNCPLNFLSSAGSATLTGVNEGSPTVFRSCAQSKSGVKALRPAASIRW
jgi:hypothetical protein